MNKIIFLTAILSLSCLSAFGSVPRQYMVEMKLSLGGKLDQSPRIVINEGKKAEVSDRNDIGEGYFLEAKVNHVPSKADNQAFLQMVVGRFKNGKKEILGSPRLMVLENEESAVELSKGDNQLYKVKVKVSRVKQ